MRSPLARDLATILSVALASACSRDDNAARHRPPQAAPVTIVPRTPEIPTYPCTTMCHARIPPNPTPRELQTFHSDKHLAHGPTLTWCAFCHQTDDYDRLHLIEGTRVSFDEAHRVCAQCHEDRYRDWTRGIHGTTTGSWLDGGVRRNCPSCHNPHDPHRSPFESLPSPASHERGHT